MAAGWPVSSACCRAGEPTKDAKKWSVAWPVERFEFKATLVGGCALTPKHCGLRATDTHGLYKDDDEREKKYKN